MGKVYVYAEFIHMKLLDREWTFLRIVLILSLNRFTLKLKYYYYSCRSFFDTVSYYSTQLLYITLYVQ